MQAIARTIDAAANTRSISNSGGWSIWKMDGWSMTADEWKMDRNARLHRAVLAFEAAVEAIPAGTSVYNEDATIQRELRKVDRIAQRILEEPGYPTFAEPRLRAGAWLDGEYWTMVNATA